MCVCLRLALKNYSEGHDSIGLWGVWVAALCGIWYQFTFHEQYKWLETLFYLMIGICPSVIALYMVSYVRCISA